jgi:hypothetical protein
MTPLEGHFWTACVQFRDSYPIKNSHLSFLSLSAVTLGIYLCVHPLAGGRDDGEG